MRENEERLNVILNTAPDAIIITDRHGIIDSGNHATEKMFGYSAAELIGQNINLLMSTSYPEELLQSDQGTSVQQMIDMGNETIGLRKDGSTFSAELTMSAIQQPELLIHILHDVSEHNMLEKQILEVFLAEQRRIGQELHDNTQQELTALTLIAGALLEAMENAPTESLANRTVRLLDEPRFASLCATARRLCEDLTATNNGVRQLAHGIIPAQINAQGLEPALDMLAKSTNDLQGVRCQFTCFQPIVVANNTAATHLYRIAQEAVTNSLRHSRAGEIHVSLTQHDTHLQLEVRDNGIGLDQSTIARNSHNHISHGMGLRIMEYRAGAIGGKLTIERGSPHGTTVNCLIPNPRE